MNEHRPYSAGTSKLAYAQVFTSPQRRHEGSLRSRLHVPTIRRRTASRAAKI